MTSTHAFYPGWRSKPYKWPEPVQQPDPEIASQTSADDEPIDSTMEETTGPEPHNDTVLEHEPDDEDDFFSLVDHVDNEDKETLTASDCWLRSAKCHDGSCFLLAARQPAVALFKHFRRLGKIYEAGA